MTMAEDGKQRQKRPDRAAAGAALGRSLAEIQADNMAERKFTDLMSSAGIGSHRMAQEVLFHLPKDFVNLYEEVFYRAFGGKDDGGTNARGQSQAESGVLQKGKSAAKSGGKRYKRHWVIADEAAVDLKDRIDKRLRAMVREARLELVLGKAELTRLMSETDHRCKSCGKLAGKGWKYCPFDGEEIG